MFRSIFKKFNKYNKPLSKIRRIFNIIYSSVVWILFLFVLICCLFVFFQSVILKKPTNLFGYKYYFILTDSMTPTFQVHDVIVSQLYDHKKNKPSIEVNDIVTFKDSYLGATKTHRVVEAPVKDANGEYYIRTRGDKPGAPIDSPVKLSDVQAKFVKKSGLVSTLYKWGINSNSSWIYAIMLVPFFFMLVSMVLRLIHIIKSKPEEIKHTAEPPEPTEEYKQQVIAEYLKQQQLASNETFSSDDSEKLNNQETQSTDKLEGQTPSETDSDSDTNTEL